jgi:arylsulfatase A-like enzyme
VAPKKYYDLYDPSKIKLADNPYPPKDIFEPAMTNWSELRNYKGIPKKGPMPDEDARKLIHGYLAATSYTDAQIGRVLDELDRLGLRENTVVALWGDHGWHLGEHGLWCKHTNFEVATRSPMIMSAPSQKKRGTKTEALTEFVDVYPTLCDLCGLPLPKGLEGTSYAPLLDTPNRPWKKAAFSQYPRGNLMGHSIRTERYRYTEWAEPGKEPEGQELYDYEKDPGENVNIAKLAESKQVVEKLSKMLHEGWKAAKP